MPADQDPLRFARDLMRFIDAAPTPYHVVEEVKGRLLQHEFAEIAERESWNLEPGFRGVVTRGGSLIAFVQGTHPPAEAGFVIVGAHTDSPNLRLKPRSDRESVGYRQLAVEVYGSPLLHTWLDRDLGLAGRVGLGDGTMALVRLARPLCRIPSLAIHLNRDVNKEGLVLNAQQHLMPLLALDAKRPWIFAELLLSALAEGGHTGLRERDILSMDLCLYDLQCSSLAGAFGEFILASRLDNLASCHAALVALEGASPDSAPTRVIALYDHEEVGSQSATGARSRLLESVLERLATASSPPRGQDFPRALSRSFMVSCDMAHAVHPNYPDKHDKLHQPLIGAGPVVKFNANQSYATDAAGAARFVRACRACDVEPQHFASRNDMPCGSTIGPISAARLGIACVDVGNPMLSMHSCREMAGTSDVAPMIRVLSEIFRSSGPNN